ncbi:MAG: hypothetical protein U1C33_00135, partial [Candidatus Cloacimonadaceae bacterium]|nr:hypothetical protein [Candidatus Cloacimonadaceae bacterium]
PSGDLILSYTDSYPRGYFRPISETNPIGYGTGEWDWIWRERQLIARIVSVLDQDIPESFIVDSDNDGYVDHVTFVIQGVTDGWAEMLWPHMSIMNNPAVTINGAIVSQYNFIIESFIIAYYGGVSVLAHEMFHSIGAPDLYRYTNQTITPIGQWDLMAADTVPPQQTAAWMKYRYGGWVSVPLPIMQSGTYSLSPLVTSSTNISYRINSWRANEYYILEYRKPSEYIDSMVPGTGLLVYRLLLNVEGNSEGPPDELYIYRPHSSNNNIQGLLYQAAMSVQNGFTAINETTVPSGFTSINTPGGLNIYEVGEAGETISFKVKISDVQLTSPLANDVWISGSYSQIRWKA